MRPETKSIGSSAAITVRVVTMVGLPTSATALDGGPDARSPVIHGPVAGDVLDHDDGVVDEDADGKDQREKAYPVDGVAHQPGREHGEEDRRRNDDEDDDAFAPADDEADEDDDGDRRKAEVEQELVGLLVRGLAVVAGDVDGERLRHQAVLQVLHLRQRFLPR